MPTHHSEGTPASCSAPERGDKITSEGHDELFMGLETPRQWIRRDSCWQLKISCLGLEIKGRNVRFHGTPRNRWLPQSGKAHSPAPALSAAPMATCISGTEGGSIKCPQDKPRKCRKAKAWAYRRRISRHGSGDIMTLLPSPSLTLPSCVISFMALTPTVLNQVLCCAGCPALHFISFPHETVNWA